MNKDSPEYKKIKAEHEARQEYRRKHPDLFPWWAYFQFGWHNMTYLTDEECKDAVKFYHLWPDRKGGFYRVGRQPIFIMRREEKNGEQKQ